MICPKCELEYVEGITVCADCDIELITIKEFENHLIKNSDWVILYTTDVLYEAEMLKANLEGAEIKAIVLSQKDASFPVPGDLTIVKLLVQKKDEETAQSIIAEIIESDEEDEIDFEDDDLDE